MLSDCAYTLADLDYSLPYLSDLALLDLQDVWTGTSMAGRSAVVMSVKQPDFLCGSTLMLMFSGVLSHCPSYDQKVR